MPEVSEADVEDLLRQYLAVLQTAELPAGLAAEIPAPPPGAPRRRLKPRWGRIALAILLLLAILAGLFALLTHSGSTSNGGNPSTLPTQGRDWNVSPMTATFESALFATEYSATVIPTPGKTLPPLTAHWTLSLTLVDPAGAADPSEPGSGAGVDQGCDNAGDGTTQPHLVHLAGQNGSTAFVWHHPDAGSDPTGTYHCNHSLQGPHGHQGRVTLTVSDGVWQCSESVDGTHDTQGGPELCTKA